MLEVFAAGVLLVVVVLGAVTLVLDSLIQKFVPKAFRYRGLMRNGIVILTWLCTLPIAGAIIDITPLKHLAWGHIGEMLLLPFFMFSPFVLYWLFRRANK